MELAQVVKLTVYIAMGFSDASFLRESLMWTQASIDLWSIITRFQNILKYFPASDGTHHFSDSLFTQRMT